MQKNPQEEGDKALAEAATHMLRELRDLVRYQPRGQRAPIQIPVGDGYISISETHAGLEIEDHKSQACCSIPDRNLDSLMHALAQEVEDKPGLYGSEAVSVAGEITAHTLRGLPPELRRAITQRLDGSHSAALVCAGRSLADDPSVRARVLESVGPQLMARDCLDGPATAI